jgi:hypothetical protein
MHGEYIELEGVSADDDLVEALVDLLRPLWVDWSVVGYPAMTLTDDRTMVVVDFDPGGGAGPTLAIGNIDDDDQACWIAAGDVYRAVLGGTDWRPRWTYDTPDGEVLRELGTNRCAMVATSLERTFTHIGEHRAR